MIKISDIKKLPIQAKASFWALVGTFIQRGISTITTPIFTRLLTTEEYGQYNVFNSWFGIMTIIISLNMFSGLHQQGLIKYYDKRYEFSSSLLGLTTLLVAIWTGIYFCFQDFWNELLSLTTLQMICAMTLVLLMATFNFWVNEQRIHYSYKWILILSVGVALFNPLLGVFLVTHSEDKVTARILGIVLVELIAYSGLYYIQMKRGKKFCSLSYWKYAVLYSLPLVPHYLSLIILNSSDKIMISRMVGESEAGIYSLAYSVSSIMSIFNAAISQTIAPWIYRRIKDNRTEELSKVGYTTIVVIAVINLLVIAFGPEAVAIFAPNSYYQAVWIIPPVAIGSVFSYAYDLFSKFAFFHEKNTFTMFLSIGGALINIVLNYIFIHLFGYLAAGYTTLMCFIIFAIGHYIYMRKLCRQFHDRKYPYDGRVVTLILLILVVVGIAMMVTYNYIIIRYCIIAMIIAVLILMRKKISLIIRNIMSLKKEQ